MCGYIPTSSAFSKALLDQEHCFTKWHLYRVSSGYLTVSLRVGPRTDLMWDSYCCTLCGPTAGTQ